MKHLPFAALFIAAMLAACGSPQSGDTTDPAGEADLAATPAGDTGEPGSDSGEDGEATAQPASESPAASAPVELRNTARDGTAASVSVTYDPAIAGYDARLSRRIAEASEKDLDAFEAEAKAMGAGQGGNAPAHSLMIDWRVTWRGTDVISIVRDVSYYTGGAHPNAAVSTLIWDRSEGRELGLADLFASEEAAYSALLEPVRARLVAARSERLGMSGMSERDLRLDVEDTVSRDAGSLDRLALSAGEDASLAGELIVFFPPYEVAPYVEGSYVIAVPAGTFRDDLAEPYQAMFAPR